MSTDTIYMYEILLILHRYGGCIDANTYVYCAEIFPTHIRPRGMALSMVTLFVTSTPFLEAAPTAFATIGWKYYLVFIVLTAINIPIMYFYLPEVGFSYPPFTLLLPLVLLQH